MHALENKANMRIIQQTNSGKTVIIEYLYVEVLTITKIETLLFYELGIFVYSVPLELLHLEGVIFSPWFFCIKVPIFKAC